MGEMETIPCLYEARRKETQSMGCCPRLATEKKVFILLIDTSIKTISSISALFSPRRQKCSALRTLFACDKTFERCKKKLLVKF